VTGEDTLFSFTIIKVPSKPWFIVANMTKVGGRPEIGIDPVLGNRIVCTAHDAVNNFRREASALEFVPVIENETGIVMPTPTSSTLNDTSSSHAPIITSQF
jgi:hypothetical protein